MEKFIINSIVGPSADQRDFLNTLSLYVGTPVFGGTPEMAYVRSIMSFQGYMERYDIKTGFGLDSLSSESLINRGRNTIANRFLETDFSHLLFIDADISFKPEHPLELLLSNVPVVAANYPKKDIDWRRIATAVLNGVLTDDLRFHASKPATTWSVDGKREIHRNKLMPCDYLPTGMMLISRGALERYKSVFSDEWYLSPLDKVSHWWDFFPTGINKRNRVLEGEDYGFTRRCAEIGVGTFLAPWIDLGHTGKFLFEGNLFGASS